MEAGTQQPQGSGKPKPSDDLPKDAPPAVRDLADGGEEAGRKTDREGEKSVIAWFLGQQAPARYKMPIEFDTPVGTMTMDWVIRSLDGKTLDDIEKRNTPDDAGPFGEMDDLAANAEIVAEATVVIRDPKSGEELKIDDPRIRSTGDGREVASIADAIKARFHWQSGLLAGMAGNVRRASGWAPDRVGAASRVMSDAAGNSSNGEATSG